MRDLATVKFILARVMDEIRANPPSGPLLVETPTRRPDWECRYGHLAWAWRSGLWYCADCRNARRRAAYRDGRDA